MKFICKAQYYCMHCECMCVFIDNCNVQCNCMYIYVDCICSCTANTSVGQSKLSVNALWKRSRTVNLHSLTEECLSSIGVAVEQSGNDPRDAADDNTE